MEPFQPQGLESIRTRFLLREEVATYFFALASVAATAPLNDFGSDGEVPFTGTYVGGAVAKVDRDERIYGPHTFLHADAVFGRYQDGQVYMQDRIGEDLPSTPYVPTSINNYFRGGRQSSGIAGPDGRRPGVKPWQEKDPAGPIDVTGQAVTFMGPSEHKLVDPYCIVIRGSGYGKKALLEDHFAFTGDHFHISDHRGGDTGRASPDDRRSTRWYDIDPATGKPWTDSGTPGDVDFVRGYNAHSDKLWKVHKQIPKCGGGDAADMTLVLNMSDNTGQGYGLAEFKSGSPYFTAGTGPRTAAAMDPETLLGFMAYAKGGPFTAGHPKADKHYVGTNGDGVRANSVHIHINAKYTNDSIKYDGRLPFETKDIPPLKKGVIPVFAHLQWNPQRADPHVCGDEIGAWEIWSWMNSAPVHDERIVKDADERFAKDGDERHQKDPDERHRKNVPILPEYGKESPPAEWHPLEQRVPSTEHQPRPGNTEDPSEVPHDAVPPTVGGERGDDNTTSGADADDDFEALQREIARQARGKRDESAEYSVYHLTGLRLSEHHKSPLVGHETSFYRHVKSEPIDGRRGLERHLPAYNKLPKYYPAGQGQSQDALDEGTADGVVMIHPPEYKSFDLRHDRPAHKKPDSPSTFWKGYYPGAGLAFGFMGDDWGDVVGGVRIFQDTSDLDVVTVRGVDTSGALDRDKSVEFEIPVGIPAMTTAQRNGIAAPYSGMLVYDTDDEDGYVYNGIAATWDALGAGGGAGATTFLGLTDTPSSYAAQAGKFVRVNSTPNGLEFTNEPVLAPSALNTDLSIIVADNASGDRAVKHTDVTIDGANMAGLGFLEMSEIAEPSNPASGKARLWMADEAGFDFLSIKDDNGVLRELGRDNVFVVRNNTGSTITRGTPVYFNGATGVYPTIAEAQADAAGTMPCEGLVVSDIATASFGLVMPLGDLDGLDTSADADGNALADGDILYVDENAAGGWVKTKPTGSNIVQRVATVVKAGSGSSGILKVGVKDTDHATRPLTAGGTGATTADAALENLVNGATSRGLALNDKIPFKDLSVDPGGGYTTPQDVHDLIPDLTPITSVVAADEIAVYSQFDAETRAATFANLKGRSEVRVFNYTGSGAIGKTVPLTGVNRAYKIFCMRVDNTANQPMTSLPGGGTGNQQVQFDGGGLAGALISLDAPAAGSSQTLTINTTNAGVNANGVSYKCIAVGTPI